MTSFSKSMPLGVSVLMMACASSGAENQREPPVGEAFPYRTERADTIKFDILEPYVEKEWIVMNVRISNLSARTVAFAFDQEASSHFGDYGAIHHLMVAFDDKEIYWHTDPRSYPVFGERHWDPCGSTGQPRIVEPGMWIEQVIRVKLSARPLAQKRVSISVHFKVKKLDLTKSGPRCSDKTYFTGSATFEGIL